MCIFIKVFMEEKKEEVQLQSRWDVFFIMYETESNLTDYSEQDFNFSNEDGRIYEEENMGRY